MGDLSNLHFIGEPPSNEASGVRGLLQRLTSDSEAVWRAYRHQQPGYHAFYIVATNARLFLVGADGGEGVMTQLFHDDVEQVTAKPDGAVQIMSRNGGKRGRPGNWFTVAASLAQPGQADDLALVVSHARATQASVDAVRNELLNDPDFERPYLDGPAPRTDNAQSTSDAEPRHAAEAGPLPLVVGQQPSSKALRAILDHADAGEMPWLIIGNGSAGVLAAFEDRLMIVKVGALTSMMAGSFGGGRVTVFPFHDITAVEYNSGMLNGVLEVLTPSYQGTSNKDYWRGSGKSRNANADDPWTLSNTMPLAKHTYQEALPHLNKLRKMISDAKRPQMVVSQPQPVPAATGTAGMLSTEIAQLADLHRSGMLSAAEFDAAKRALLGQHVGPAAAASPFPEAGRSDVELQPLIAQVMAETHDELQTAKKAARVEALQVELAHLEEGDTPTQIDATALMHALQAGAGCTGIQFLTTEDDPNGQLGKPGGYVAKAFFEDPTVPDAIRAEERGSADAGGSLEVFESRAAALGRANYVRRAESFMADQMAKLGAAGVVSPEAQLIAGPALLRLSKNVSAEQVNRYRDVLQRATGQTITDN